MSKRYLQEVMSLKNNQIDREQGRSDPVLVSLPGTGSSLRRAWAQHECCDGPKGVEQGNLLLVLAPHCCSKGPSKVLLEDFPDGTVDKNLRANAGDTGLIPSQGRFHRPQSNKAPCATTTEPVL